MGRLPSKSGAILEAVLYRGELLRGDAAAIVGTGDRQARRVVSALIDRRVLVSESARAPLRLSFPATLASRWMPGLFPDQGAQHQSAERTAHPNVDDKAPNPIVIPHAELSGEALRGVVESVVLREGTDYGEREFSFEEKVEHVLARLKRGEAQIMFDPDSETVQIVVAARPVHSD